MQSRFHPWCPGWWGLGVTISASPLSRSCLLEPAHAFGEQRESWERLSPAGMLSTWKEMSKNVHNSSVGAQQLQQEQGGVGFVQHHHSRAHRGRGDSWKCKPWALGSRGNEWTAMDSSLPYTKCTRKLLEDPTPKSPDYPDREGVNSSLKGSQASLDRSLFSPWSIL